jgi:RNA polymerase sigma-70 factor (ECF subfamily)
VIDEHELIHRARDGDQAAFGSLVLQYQTPVYNLAYRMLGNATEAEDAAQEAFLRVFLNLRKYDPSRSFRTWVLSITSHHCIDRIRKRRITWLPLEEEIAGPTRTWEDSRQPSPHDVVVREERDRHLQDMLAALGPVDRAAITLCYWYDCSYEEIAEVLDLTVGAVKSRLYRARRALADMMRGEAAREGADRRPAAPAPLVAEKATAREEVCYAM